MVDGLLVGVDLDAQTSILDPGCGDGAFIAGIIRWCAERKLALPRIVGVEACPELAAHARSLFRDYRSVEVHDGDFLARGWGTYDFVIGNPPYVSITALSRSERDLYRSRFETAQGRFDLYLLFFEQALKCLQPRGRLAFITPEKFLYTSTAVPLRRMLSRLQVEEIRLLDEETFEGFVTYPTVTTLANIPANAMTALILRDGRCTMARLPASGASWQPFFHGSAGDATRAIKLEDVCVRVSCGVATGADNVFVHRTATLNDSLRGFAYPTIAGRELNPNVPDYQATASILVPYAPSGELLPESRLGALKAFLQEAARREQLLKRTCSQRKAWYAFHDNLPLSDMLRPKILCKDIAAKPYFWLDRRGELVPRHSVYYIVPKNSDVIDRLCAFLNSDDARNWLTSHCQRAANGFLRLQSHVLKQLPLPADFAAEMHTSPSSNDRRTARNQMNLPMFPTHAHTV